MENLDTKEKIELTIVIILTVIYFLTKELELVSEQNAQTFGSSLYIFVWFIVILRLYRLWKRVKKNNI